MKEYLVKKDKTLGAKELIELLGYYTKLHENKKPEKPITITYGHLINMPHMETSLLPSAWMVKRNNRNEMCHNNSIREHIQTHVKASAWAHSLKQDQET